MSQSCTYTFKGPDGRKMTIEGASALKAYLATGGLEFLLGEARADLARRPEQVLASQGREGDWSRLPGTHATKAAAEATVKVKVNGAKGTKPNPAWREYEFRIGQGRDDQWYVDARKRPGAASMKLSDKISYEGVTRSANRQIDAPEFKTWSGGNPVVLAAEASKHQFETGKPVVVEGFHGTRRNFDRVDTAQASAGYFLTSKPLVADEYAGVYPEGMGGGSFPLGGNVQRQYVRMDNPLVVNARGASFNRVDTRAIPGYPLQISNTDAINQWAKSQGYDGIIYKDLRDSMSRPDGRNAPPSNVYVTFKPSFVKSAVGNSGEYSLQEESFLASRDRVTATPEFKKWFGDSKVVDAQGKPLVVYHGTSTGKDFARFKTPAYFTDQPEGAQLFGEDNADIESDDAGREVAVNSRLMPVYLSIQNPKVVAGWDDFMEWNARRRTAAEKEGYDGLSIEMPDGERMFVAFRPEQIKSAIGNSGAFDPTNPNITKSAQRELPRGYVGPVSEEEREQGRLVVRLEGEAYKAWADGRDRARDEIAREIADGMSSRDGAPRIDDSIVAEVALTTALQRVAPGEKYDPEKHPFFSQYRELSGKVEAARVELRKMVDARVGSPEFDSMRQLADFDRRQVRTPEFRRWFRDSKVTDGQGRPLIVFHGTNKDLSEFATVREAGAVRNNNWFGQLGSWFAAPQPGAEGYEPGSAEFTAEAFSELRGDEGSAVYPVYLSIQNPYEVEGYESLTEERDDAGGAAAFRQMLVKQGYDGVVVRESDTDGGQFRDDWVAFYPTQIKSAIGNRGTFGLDDSDITRSSGRDAKPLSIEQNSREWAVNGKPTITLNEANFGGGSIVVWVDGDRENYITSIAAYGDVRGHEMLRWLKGHTGKPSFAVDAVDDAIGFYERMGELGLVSGYTQDMVESFFGIDFGDGEPRRYAGDVRFNRDNARRSAERFTDDQREELERAGREAEDAIRSAPRDYNVDLTAQQEAEKPAKAWIEKVYAGLPRNPMMPRQRVMMFGEDDFAVLELDASGLNPGGVTINWIQAYPLRSGNGTKAIRELQRMAAEDGIELDLWPWDKGRVSQANLIKFYKSVGFEPIKRGSKNMIWRPEGVSRSADRSPMGFYSALAKGIEGLPTKQAPAGAWKAAIKGLVNKGAAKADEVEWSGINDWLDLQQGKVTKEQVSEYLKQGGVRVEEVQMGGPRGLPAILSDYFENTTVRRPTTTEGWIAEAARQERKARQFQAQGNDRLAKRLFELSEAMNEYAESGETGALAAQYSKHTLPGGENYREVLLTLPTNDARKVARRAELAELDRNRPLSDEEQKEFDSLRDFAKGGNAYRSRHWDQPNVLAHIRANDRTDADGKRVLFVEEIQSDWGQEGKKKGFASGDWEAPYKEWERGLRERAKSFYLDAAETAEERAAAVRMGEKLAAREDLGSIATVMNERSQMAEAWAKATALRDKVPTAPFVTKTEGWLNLALKRVMIMAAEEGYDKVAFVNGEQSADRYDLSKQVNYIQWSPGYNANRRLVTLEMSDGKELGLTVQDGVVEDSSIGADGKPLEDVLGKEIAKKILDAESGDLRGLDLKVGGEGMKAFYDTIVPTALKKLLPKVGGGQVGAVSISPGFQVFQIDENLWGNNVDDRTYPSEAEARRAAGTPQPGFDITPAMREKVAEGLPLFSRDRPGINVRSDGDNRYADLIVDGEKTLESRDSDSLRPYVGKTVGIVRTGEGQARLIGSAKIGEPTEVDATEFRAREPEHMVPEGSRFDIKPGSTKWLYPLTEAKRFDEDAPVDSRGIVSRRVRFSRDRASWTDGRIDSLLRTHAYTMDDGRSKAYAGFVAPEDFLRATTPAGSVDRLESEKRPLSVKELADEDQPIFLLGEPQKDGTWKTTGHEGRHRMMALRDAGVRRVPVVFDVGYGLTREPLQGLYVTPQRWSGAGQAQGGFFVDNLIPISYKHADDLRDVFGGEGAVRFSPDRAQTETPEFKRWFGNSQIRDESGDPLVVYHATPGDFAEFKPGGNDPTLSGPAMWFTDSKEYQPAAHNIGRRKGMFEDGANVMPVYLKMERPLVIDDKGMLDWSREVFAGGSIQFPHLLPKKWVDEVRRDGEYDGIIFDGPALGWKDAVREYIVFEPTQIKSAIGNSGAFATDNPDITRSAQRDLFPGEFATKRTTAETITVIDSRGTRARGGNTNSEGQQVAATKQGLQRFWGWFAGSEATDGKGRPLVLYHSTNSDVTRFETNRESTNSYGILGEMKVRRAGIFLTPDPKFSQEYLRDGAGQNVMKVYAALKNPLDLRNGLSEADWRALTDAGISTRYVTNIQNYWELFDSADDGTNDFVDGLKAAGYDGAVFHEDSPGGESKGGTTYVAFYPTQIKSAIGNLGAFDPTSPDITKSEDREDRATSAWQTPSASKFDDWVYKLQDKQVDTKRVVDEIKDVAGALADDLDVYLQEELFHGRAAKRTEDFVNKELRPLVDAMAKDGLKIEDLDTFLHARHAREANAVIAQRNPEIQDGGSGMTNQDAADYFANLDEAQRRKLETAAAKVDAILAETRKMMVDYQLESPDVIKGWGEMFQHYVPLMREDEGAGAGIGQGFSIKGREVKSRTGSTRKVVDIFANIAMQRERTIVRGEKNRVSQALHGLATANPNKEFWTVDKVPTTPTFNPATGLVEDRPDNLFKMRDNVIVSKVLEQDDEGRTVVREKAVIFDEKNERAVRMATALKNLDAAQLEGLMGASAAVTRYFASINTQYNPVFGIINLMRDVQGAIVNLNTTELKDDKLKVARGTMSALMGIMADARKARRGEAGTSEWSALWEDFQSVGGQTGYRQLFQTSADRAKDIQRALNPDAWMDSKLGRIFTVNGTLKVPLSVAMKGARWLFDLLSDYNLAMENGIRLSAYKVALDKGMSRERAASLAKNLTVNFNRKGQVGQQAGALYAFFNAAMQGTARLGQTLFEMEPGKPKTIRLSSLGKKIVYGGMLLGTAQAVALSMMGFSDDDPPDFVRERSLIIPTGGKTYISIPMPLGLHVIPNVGRVTTEWALSGFKNTPQRVASLLGTFADSFNPIGNAGWSMQTLAPTALDPLVALTENKDWQGRPIAKESMNRDMPGPQLYRDTATSWSKLISESINYLSGGDKYSRGVLSPTPDQIDYLVGQLTGGVGREISKVEQAVMGLVRGEEVPTYKVPLVGRLIGDSGSQASEGTAFYANAQKLNKLETEIKLLREDGKTAEAQALRASRPEAYLMTQANYAERAIQRLRKEKSELIKDGGPREKIREIEERITARMAGLNRAMEALEAAR